MTEMTFATAPGALPLIGHALQLRTGILDYLSSLPAHGDLVEVRVGPWPAYVICHPDLVQHVLLNDRTFDRGGRFFDKLREVAGDGIATCPHSEHRGRRRLLQPAFHHDNFPGYAQVMAEQIAEVVEAWQDGQVIDVPAQMNALTSKVTAKTLFTADSAAPAARAVAESLDDIMGGIFRHLVMPLAMLEKLPTRGKRRFQRASDTVRKAVGRTIEDYRRDGTDHADLLSVLLAARHEDGRPLRDSEIHDEIIVLLLAAIDTTSSNLSWTLYLLARHQEIQKRLHAELDTVLGGRQAGWEDLPRLELTGRILTEALRIHPPGWIFTRIVTADTRLAGRHLPAGTTLIYSPYLIQHRADLYPEPDRFDPDRFLPGAMAERPRNAFTSFGSGARKCLGDNFAMTEGTLALAAIAARWHLSPTTDTPARGSHRAIMTPQSLRLHLTARG